MLFHSVLSGYNTDEKKQLVPSPGHCRVGCACSPHVCSSFLRGLHVFPHPRHVHRRQTGVPTLSCLGECGDACTLCCQGLLCRVRAHLAPWAASRGSGHPNLSWNRWVGREWPDLLSFIFLTCMSSSYLLQCLTLEGFLRSYSKSGDVFVIRNVPYKLISWFYPLACGQVGFVIRCLVCVT